jgi:hypothetical protein
VTNTTQSVLCGGTFLAQILQSRRPTATRRQRTRGVSDAFHEQDVLLGLVQLVQPDYIKPAGDTFKTYTTYFKRCGDNTPLELQFENEAVVSAFLTRMATDYPAELNKATGFVRRFIDVGTTAQNDVLLVKRLIELIRDDSSIPDTALFVVAEDRIALSKTDLVNITKVNLPAFILDVWKYIVTEKKNNGDGMATISAWFPSRTDRYEGIDGATIAQDIDVECSEYIEPVVSGSQ